MKPYPTYTVDHTRLPQVIEGMLSFTDGYEYLTGVCPACIVRQDSMGIQLEHEKECLLMKQNNKEL